MIYCNVLAIASHLAPCRLEKDHEMSKGHDFRPWEEVFAELARVSQALEEAADLLARVTAERDEAQSELRGAIKIELDHAISILATAHGMEPPKFAKAFEALSAGLRALTQNPEETGQPRVHTSEPSAASDRSAPVPAVSAPTFDELEVEKLRHYHAVQSRKIAEAHAAFHELMLDPTFEHSKTQESDPATQMRLLVQAERTAAQREHGRLAKQTMSEIIRRARAERQLEEARARIRTLEYAPAPASPSEKSALKVPHSLCAHCGVVKVDEDGACILCGSDALLSNDARAELSARLSSAVARAVEAERAQLRIAVQINGSLAASEATMAADAYYRKHGKEDATALAAAKGARRATEAILAAFDRARSQPTELKP